MTRYYINERNTGAMNGCYREKAEAERSAKSLSKRHRGSQWDLIAVDGSHLSGKFPPDSLWHGNEPMLSKLKALK